MTKIVSIMNFFVLSITSVFTQDIFQIPSDVELLPNDLSPVHMSVARLRFALDENASLLEIRDYARDHDVATSDLIDLSGLKRRSLNETLDLIVHLNLTELLTVDGFKSILDTANVTFGAFYEHSKKLLAPEGIAIAEAVKDLNLNNDFFMAVSTDYPNIYEVLRNGTYSRERFDSAFNKLDTSADIFFEIARDFVLNAMENVPDLKSVGMLRDKRFFNNLWEALGVTIKDVTGVKFFGNMLMYLVEELNNGRLAVITGTNQITIHRKVYENVTNLTNHAIIGAEPFSIVPHIYQNLTISKIDEKLVHLYSSENTTNHIKIAYDVPKNLTNCTYIFKFEGGFFEQPIDRVTIASGYLKVSNLSYYQTGSPLICERRLRGFAAKADGNDVIFDAFYTTTASSAAKFETFALFLPIVFLFKFL